MDIPKELRYTKDHEWANQDEAAITVGITAFAVDQLGDITLVELPDPGTELKEGDAFGTVESVKSVSELYAPAAGTVTAVNTRLEQEPELVNSSPYGDGWMVKIATAGGELTELLDAEAYATLVANASGE